MNQIIEVTITAEVPDGSHDLGHEAIVGTKEPAQAIVDKLTTLGLVNIKQTRRMIKRKATKEAQPKTAPATPAQPEPSPVQSTAPAVIEEVAG